MVFKAIEVTHTQGGKCANGMSMYNPKIVQILSPNYPDDYDSSVSS